MLPFVLVSVPGLWCITANDSITGVQEAEYEKESTHSLRDGGGSCSVQGNSTADGWSYTISNNIHLINAAGEDIDAGVPVSAELVTVADDGTRDYSAFCDIGRIRELIR